MTFIGSAAGAVCPKERRTKVSTDAI